MPRKLHALKPRGWRGDAVVLLALGRVVALHY
jgi:hypothetical protein